MRDYAKIISEISKITSRYTYHQVFWDDDNSRTTVLESPIFLLEEAKVQAIKWLNESTAWEGWRSVTIMGFDERGNRHPVWKHEGR
jgi:hypothetical protein